ncbi:MAG: 5-methyltetrahydrofolate--homocysteine methyltransferase [Pyrinomonadaceae bacterium]|jgi:5-methyltetrahydrofolate--homocysteine methyltransferase|nr:5-methyltetrahydrofolate--homocysteine methyltransferase [Pyrinomonadaceae bacterium]
MNKFLDTLNQRIVVFDGAMGTNIQVQNLTPEDFGGLDGCNEYLVVTKPEAVEKVHAGFLEAGCDVIETDTFGAASIVLVEYDIADKAYELNLKAAQLAKRVAADFSTKEKPRWVAGSMGPTTKLPSLGHISFLAMKQSYYDQVRGLIDGGADLLIVETCQDLLQTKSALSAIFKYFEEIKRRVPVIAQVTIEAFGTMLMGTEIGAALTALEPFPIDVIGMNCATGPKQMSENVRYLCQNATLPVSVIPNAGIPENVGGHAHYKETPESLAADLAHFARDLGVNIVGGCCGTTPAHLRAVVEAVKDITPGRRTGERLAAASSNFMQQPYRQDTSFLIVGERVNASGSRKMRDLLGAEDWDGLVSLAKEQEREGAHVLDVNVDYVGRNGEADMHELASRLSTNIKIPLMFDSTEWQKMEAGLQHAGGKCILNSTNYEDGVPRFTKVIDLAKRYGASVVIGTIDEEGMARTADGKLKIATRAFEQATSELDLPASDIFFDPLALPISTGIEEDRRNALETIEGIRRIKNELPGCFTILGVSNISFGLNPASRVVLNSVFLHDAVEAGLDAAIVNASKIEPLNRIGEKELQVARELIYDQRKFEGDVCTYDPLIEFTKLFEGVTAKSKKKASKGETVEERLKNHIIDGEKIGLEAELKTALESYPALDIVNNILLEGMKVVGDLFGSGQMQLPFVLQSAEAMKAAVRFLEPFMEKKGGATAKGTMVLATVKGDVHDIGKNLVDIILTNNGYKVINLGIKQPIENILQAHDEHKADAIGMSGLLVKSTLVMKENLELMNERGINVPVVLGGAALNRRYVDEDLKPVYKGQLFYARDAFAGLHTMDKLASGNGAEVIAGELAKAAGASAGDDVEPAEDTEDLVGEEAKLGVRKAAQPRAIRTIGDTTHTKRSNISPAVPIPQPPFYGSRVVKDIALDDVFSFVNENALFKGQWQFKQGRRPAEEYQSLVRDTVRPIYEELKERSKRERLLLPKVVYGYFPAQSAGNDLIIYQDDQKTERLRFSFPRQPESKHLCLADFFASVESERMDVVAFHLVTMGRRASEYAHELFKGDNYADYLYFHGLSVEGAEALAEFWHKRIREELGIAGDDAADINKLFRQQYQGSRFSFGYPACPDLEDQAKLFELLEPGRIDVELSEEFQLEPEQSTSAIIVHHPEAKYFSID